MAASSYSTDIQSLYVAYFGRPADPTGLDHWVGMVGSGATPLAGVVHAFSSAPEYTSVYGGMSNTELVASIYQNLFGRPPEAAGLRYWTDLLDAGLVKAEHLAVAIGEGARGSDEAVVDNKVGAAVAFTGALSDAGISGYAGSAAIDLARSFLGGVTTDASLTAAIAPAALGTAVDLVARASGAADGERLALTTGADQLVGTSGNDTITALIDNSGVPSASTLNNGDRIDGGEGVDTLTISALSNVSIAPSVEVRNVEVVNVAAKGMLNLDTRAWQGLQQLNVSEAGSAVQLRANSSTDIKLTLGVASRANLTGGKDINLRIRAVDGEANGINIAAATGAVVVDTAVTAVSARTMQMGDISVNGGSTIDISQYAGADAAVSYPGALILRQGDVAVTADERTTSVTVEQRSSTAASSSTPSVTMGQVRIQADGSAVEQIKVDGYAAGSGVFGNAAQLKSLTLANATSSFQVGATNTALNLNLEKIGSSSAGAAITLTHTPKLVLKNTGENFIELRADHTSTLALTGSGKLQMNSSQLASLDTIMVQEEVSLELDASKLASLAMVDASASSGAMRMTLDGAKVNYLGSAGADAVTVTGQVLGQSMLLGSGDDRLDLGQLSGSVRAGAGVQIDGGAGVDTLVLNGAAAAQLSATTAGAILFSGFERVHLSAWQGDTSINMATFGGSDMIVVGGAVPAAAPPAISKTDGVAGVTEVATIRLSDLGSGQHVSVGGLSVSAITTQEPGFVVTAAEVAAAITSGLSTEKVTVTGSLGGWHASAGGGDVLTLTSAVADSAVADIVVASSSAPVRVDIVQGVTAQLESNIVQFNALVQGQQVSLAGRTVTANASLTASEVAAAFASGASTAKVSVSGTLEGWSVSADGSVAAPGAVKLTSTRPGDVADLKVQAEAGSALLTLNQVEAGAIVRFDAASNLAVNLREASGALDELKVLAHADGQLKTSGIETIAIETGAASTLQLDAAGAHTIRVSGSAAQTLKLAGASQDVTVVDASATSAGFTFGGFGSAGSSERSVTGGSGADVLTSGVGAVSLRGGAGNDVFDISVPASFADHATILDFATGDQIRVAGISDAGFAASKLVLGAGAGVRDYANALINQLAQGQLGWFVHGDDTYLVADLGADGRVGFVEGEDVIVKLVGTVDLGGATFDVTSGTLGLGGV